MLKSPRGDLFKSASSQKIHKMESNGLIPTPTINFCYQYQEGSDVYAFPFFFFFFCLNYGKKKSVFCQTLIDFFENIIV